MTMSSCGHRRIHSSECRTFCERFMISSPLAAIPDRLCPSIDAMRTEFRERGVPGLLRFVIVCVRIALRNRAVPPFIASPCSPLPTRSSHASSLTCKARGIADAPASCGANKNRTLILQPRSASFLVQGIRTDLQGDMTSPQQRTRPQFSERWRPTSPS